MDFHAEATAEKQALSWFLDGKVSAVLGTHTHVATADERILPKGTAYITDVGMTGPHDSIIGVNTQPECESLIPLGIGAFMRSKVSSNEKIIINVGSGVAIEKNHSDALNYLESRLKELEIALQDTNKQRQQIAANLEQGKQQMQNFMQTSQNTTK